MSVLVEAQRCRRQRPGFVLAVTQPLLAVARILTRRVYPRAGLSTAPRLLQSPLAELRTRRLILVSKEFRSARKPAGMVRTLI